MLMTEKTAEKNVLPETKEPLAMPVLLEGTAKEKRQLTNIINEMCKSDAGLRVIETALDNDYTFMFDRTIGDTYGYADSCEEVCALNPAYPAADLITTIAHELRHVQQFESEITQDCTPSSANVKSNLMCTRVMEADAEAYGCLVSWELKDAGVAEPWNTFARDFPEIAKPFETALKENEGKPDAADKARTAAFMGWYDNLERRESYDRTYVSELDYRGPKNLDKSLKNYKPEDFVSELCHDDGKSYFTEEYKIVGSEKCVSVGKETKDRLEEFFEKRAQLPNRKPERTLNTLSIAGAEATKTAVPVAKSASARQAALDAKQERAAAAIQSAKQSSVLSCALLRARLSNQIR